MWRDTEGLPLYIQCTVQHNMLHEPTTWKHHMYLYWTRTDSHARTYSTKGSVCGLPKEGSDGDRVHSTSFTDAYTCWALFLPLTCSCSVLQPHTPSAAGNVLGFLSLSSFSHFWYVNYCFWAQLASAVCETGPKQCSHIHSFSLSFPLWSSHFFNQLPFTSPLSSPPFPPPLLSPLPLPSLVIMQWERHQTASNEKEI